MKAVNPFQFKKKVYISLQFNANKREKRKNNNEVKKLKSEQAKAYVVY